MQNAADHFSVMPITIRNHLDTKLATRQGGQLVYLFTEEISKETRDMLMINPKKVRNAATPI